MQPFVTLSVTEAEAVAAASCVMDMIYGKEFLESLGLRVKLPMVLEMDNKGAVDLFNGWSVSGNTRHISTRICFIRELKEAGTLSVKWCPGASNAADLFTKNLDRETFERHAREFIDMDAEVEGCSDTGGAAPEPGGVLESQHSIDMYETDMREKATDSAEKDGKEETESEGKKKTDSKIESNKLEGKPM
jgi:hypothetical protein